MSSKGFIENKNLPEPQAAGRASKIRPWRILWIVLFLVALIFAMGIGLFLYLQTDQAKAVLKKIVAQAIAQNTRLNCRMGEINGNIFAGFDIKNVQISDSQTLAPLLSVDRIHVSYSAPMLIFKVLSINHIDIDGLSVHLSQTQDGKWNIENLTSGKSVDKASPSSTLSYDIGRISVSNSRVWVNRWERDKEQTYQIRGIKFDATVEGFPKIGARIKHLAFECDDPKITLVDFSGRIGFDPQKEFLTIEKAEIKTARSDVGIDGKIDFSPEKPDIDVNAKISALSLPEIGDAISIQIPESGRITGTVTAKGNTEKLNHQLRLKWNECEIDSDGWTKIAENTNAFDLSGMIRHFNPAAIPVQGTDKFKGDVNADFKMNGEQLGAPDRSGQIALELKKSDVAGYFIDSAAIVAEIKGDHLFLEKAEADTPYGTISNCFADGVISSAKDFQVNINADVKKFNPAKLAPESKISGNINGSFKSSLVIPNSLSLSDGSGNFTGSVNASTINGINIYKGEGDATWSGQSVIINRLRVENELGKAEASGSLSFSDQSCQLKAGINLPDLKFVEKAFPAVVGKTQLSGSLKAEGDISGKWDHPHASLQIVAENPSVGDASAKSLQVNGTWDGGLKNFTGKGECTIDTVKIAGMEIPKVDATSQVSADKANFALNLLGGRHDQFSLSGEARNYMSQKKEVILDRIAFTSDDLPPLDSHGPAHIAFSEGKMSIDALRLDSGEASIDLKGSVGLTPSGELSAQLVLRDFNVKRISDFWVKGEKIQGKLSSDIRLSGTADNPKISVKAMLQDGAYKEFAINKVEASMEYQNARTHVSASALQGEKIIADLRGSIRTAISLYPLEIKPQPGGMDLTLKFDDVRMADMPGSKTREYEIDGALNGSIDLSGDLNQPRLAGDLKLSKGFLNLRRQKLTYETLTADVRLSPGKIDIVNIHVKGDKEGTLDLGGSISVERYMPKEFDVRVTGKDFLIPYKTGIAAKVVPNVHLTGTWDEPNLSGDILVTQGRVNLDWFYSSAPADIEIVAETIPESGTIEVPESNPQSLSFIDPLSADIKMNIPGNTWLKGTNENIEIEGNLNIRKDRGKPFLFYGPLHTVRGTYRFYGKVFNITEGELNFVGNEDFNSPWSAAGEYKVKDIKIIIRLAGTFEKINLTLDSDPVMDQVDIISYLMFGQPSTSLSQKESFSAEAAALSATGQKAVDQLREIFGEKFSIDYMNLSSEGSDIRQGELSMGKYVAPKVFVIYRQGFSQESPREVQVDYEINRHFNVQTQINDEKTSAVDLIWKYEF